MIQKGKMTTLYVIMNVIGLRLTDLGIPWNAVFVARQSCIFPRHSCMFRF